MPMDEEQFHRDDPRAISRSDQQRAEILDNLRNAEEYIVFYRDEKGEAVLITELTKGNVFNWIAVVMEELTALLEIAGEAYYTSRKRLRELE